MDVKAVEQDQELKQILWACYSYWQTEETVSLEKRSICYSWVIDRYKQRFNTAFHQSKLSRLTTLEFLEKDITSRADNRRYYKIVSPDELESLLKKWELL